MIFWVNYSVNVRVNQMVTKKRLLKKIDGNQDDKINPADNEQQVKLYILLFIISSTWTVTSNCDCKNIFIHGIIDYCEKGQIKLK